ncbi:MAG TPA: type III-A CRISPR-associated protein Csm2 [Blastocatellia bacterium]|nr:type III-A CRISPR-associated protein Csm2 [Blastocatellia bacterium]
MEKRACKQCGTSFVPKEARHTLCSNCVSKAKGGGNAPRGPQPQQRGELAKFKVYLEQLDQTGYFDADGNLREELVVKDADLVACVLSNAGVTSGQLRRFFTMSRNLEQQLDNTRNFKALVPGIAKLQPFAASVIGREQSQNKRKDLEVLLDFIDVNAQRARESEQAFRNGFLEHFESVIAYFTLYKPK